MICSLNDYTVSGTKPMNHVIIYFIFINTIRMYIVDECFMPGSDKVL